MPDATGRIRVRYATREDAERSFGSVHPDDDAFATTRLDGTSVIVELRGKDSKSLLRAADDFLACLGVAEDVMNAPPMDDRNA